MLYLHIFTTKTNNIHSRRVRERERKRDRVRVVKRTSDHKDNGKLHFSSSSLLRCPKFFFLTHSIARCLISHLPSLVRAWPLRTKVTKCPDTKRSYLEQMLIFSSPEECVREREWIEWGIVNEYKRQSRTTAVTDKRGSQWFLWNWNHWWGHFILLVLILNYSFISLI